MKTRPRGSSRQAHVLTKRKIRIICFLIGFLCLYVALGTAICLPILKHKIVPLIPVILGASITSIYLGRRLTKIQRIINQRKKRHYPTKTLNPDVGNNHKK